MEELGRTKFLLFALVGTHPFVFLSTWAICMGGALPFVSFCGRLRSVMGTFRDETKVFVRVFL